MISQGLEATFLRLAVELQSARDPWWVIGSAALALCGLAPERVKDVDLIVSPADAERLMRRHGLDNFADGGSAQFRSELLLRPDFGAVPVEILASFHIRHGADWQPVCPQTRVEIPLAGLALFVPSRGELAAIFRRCGRPSDLVHAGMLEGAETR
jgi:hypothetical protein